MDLQQIEAYLQSPDSYERMKAIAELKNYDSELAVPLLKSKIQDREFLVRSFVAMGLGKKQTAESFAALLQLTKFDADPNVRAEAANSLSLFGQVAASHLVQVFEQDDHWLVRRSILAALVEMDCAEELYEICVSGIRGEDPTVQEACTEALGLLAGSNKQNEALEQLLSLLDHQWWRIRLQVAKALGKFDVPLAKEALLTLKQDEAHQVVGAVLEELL